MASRVCYWFDELGIKSIYICPDLNYGAAVHADKWIPILPNTDAALHLAIAYVWITEGLYDKDDIFSREADILVAPELTAKFGLDFLYQSMGRRFGGYVNLLQTDGGPEFKADFQSKAHLFCNRHRIAWPYWKNEQSYIESFNRTVRKECLGWQKCRIQDLAECQNKVELFLVRYHYHRPHMGLGMTPPLLDKEGHCRISTEN